VKHVPNSITVIRILLTIALLFFEPFSNLFDAAYILGGLSDLLDGYIARKTKTMSKMGARLDSIADFIMVAVLFVKLIPVLRIPYVIYGWILLIAVIRFLSMLIVMRKFHTLAILHTYTNKATGITLFFFPLLYQKINIMILSTIICVLASISAVEELLIHITSGKLIEDRKSFFTRS
jgi:CDP-diacylglycerol--glycerol-3-phosphate 3-phosphatidyltransferase